MSTLSVQVNKTGQLFTVGKGRFPHLNSVFKWKSGFHNKNSEEYMLPSKSYLRGSADKHEKKLISVKQIQNCRGKQCFAVSRAGFFSPLGGFDAKTCQFESIAR